MKKLLFLLSVFVLSTLSAVSVYAGSWHRDNIGGSLTLLFLVV